MSDARLPGRAPVLGPVWTLALDVLGLARRRGVTVAYLLLGAAVALLATSQIEVRGEQVRHAPSILRGELPLPGPGLPLPGSLQVATVDRVLLRDGGDGQLRDEAGAIAGSLVPARGLLLAAEVAPPRSATITWAVDLSTRAARRAAGAPTRVVVSALGAERRWDEGRIGPGQGEAELVTRELTLAWLYQLLVVVAASVPGQMLGLLAVVNAVPSAFRAGEAPLLLPRPVGRSRVVLGRFLGGLVFAALQLAWMLGLAVLAMWVRLELLPWPLLLAGAAQLLKFALLFAAATACALVARSVILGLVGAIGAWSVSFALGFLGGARGELGPLAAALRLDVLLGWLDAIWPPIAAMDRVSSALCGLEDASLAPSLTVRAGAWVALLLTLSYLAVRRRDC
jgi:hypothetical protein